MLSLLCNSQDTENGNGVGSKSPSYLQLDLSNWEIGPTPNVGSISSNDKISFSSPLIPFLFLSISSIALLTLTILSIHEDHVPLPLASAPAAACLIIVVVRHGYDNSWDYINRAAGPYS